MSAWSRFGPDWEDAQLPYTVRNEGTHSHKKDVDRTCRRNAFPGLLSNTTFEEAFSSTRANDLSSTVLVTFAGLLGSCAVLALLCVAHRLGLIRCVVLRQLGAVAAACALRAWVLRLRDPDFLLSDLAGVAVVTVGVSIVAVEVMFF